MKTLISILLTFFVSLAYASDSLRYIVPVKAEPQKIGIRYIEAEVIFSTDKYNLHACRKKKSLRRKMGFYVARRTDNDMLVFYCGTDKKRGDKVDVTIEEGI